MKFKVFAIAAILVLTVLLVQAQTNPSEERSVAWLVEANRRAFLADDYFEVSPDHNIIAVLVVPSETTAEQVGAAWTYAMRYGADGLDLANYERAMEIIMERHPTWEVYPTNGFLVRYGRIDASLDRQDPALTPIPESTPES